MYQQLLTTWVLVPLAGAPSGLNPGVHMLQSRFTAQVRFWQQDPEGPAYLPVFFTQGRLEAVAREKWGLNAVNFISLPGREVMALEHPENLSGCVLDPDGAHITLDREAMADLAAGQVPGTLQRLLVAGELDPESRAAAVALLPQYRFHVIVGAQVETPEEIGLVVFRRPDGGSSLPLFTAQEPLRAFATRWGLVQADGNISTDYLGGEELLKVAAKNRWYLGIDSGTNRQAFFAPEEYS